jgi:hypothetical protein
MLSFLTLASVSAPIARSIASSDLRCLLLRGVLTALVSSVAPVLRPLGAQSLPPSPIAQRSDIRSGSKPAPVKPLVFDDVTVIDVQQGTRLVRQRVVIVGNRIRAIGKLEAVPIPANAWVVDAHGKYLMPGLWDMHTHSMLMTDVFYPMFLANGVTGIRDAWSPVPLDTLRRWRQEIVAGTRVGPPRQLLVGAALDEDDGNNPCMRGPGQGHTCVKSAADARHVVDSLKAAGADMIKMYDLSRSMYFTVAAEARRIGIPFGGHVGDVLGAVGWSSGGWYAGSAAEASDSGASLLDHFKSAGDLWQYCAGPEATLQRCHAMAERFRRNGSWWVPTLVGGLSTFQFADRSTAAAMMMTPPVPLGTVAQSILVRFRDVDSAFWSKDRGNASLLQPFSWLSVFASGPKISPIGTPAPIADTGGLLHLVHQMGFPLLAGSDCMNDPDNYHMIPGVSLHVELALLVAEGLTPLEALQSATLNPAKLLHATDSLGTVTAGKLADLVLLDADPLVDIANTTTIRAVVANGRYFDRPTLDQLMTAARAAAQEGSYP